MNAGRAGIVEIDGRGIVEIEAVAGRVARNTGGAIPACVTDRAGPPIVTVRDAGAAGMPRRTPEAVQDLPPPRALLVAEYVTGCITARPGCAVRDCPIVTTFTVIPRALGGATVRGCPIVTTFTLAPRDRTGATARGCPIVTTFTLAPRDRTGAAVRDCPIVTTFTLVPRDRAGALTVTVRARGAAGAPRCE